MAAAGAKMAFNSGKFSLGGYNSAKEMELTQDLHLKMSKKIAQLTKVIYALNTKNDENEAIVANVRTQYEEQIKSLLADTKGKTEFYRQQLLELKEKMELVSRNEETTKSYEVEKQLALKELERLLKIAEERESLLKAEHAEKLNSVLEQFTGVKKELETNLAQMDGLQKRYEKEKESAIQEVEELHKRRTEAAIQSRDDVHFVQIESIKKEMSAQHEAELDALQQRLQSQDAEKRHLQEEFDAKLNKAQAFYDKELEALKITQNSSHEERYRTLMDSYEKLRKQKEAEDNSAKQRIDELTNKSSLEEETNKKLRGELGTLMKSLAAAESDVLRSNEELSSARTELSHLQAVLSQQKAELVSTKLISEQQTKDLMEKSGRVAELEASMMQQLSTVKDLTNQRDELKRRVALLEGLKHSLEKDSVTQVEEQEIRYKTLQKMLEDLTESKEKMTQRYEEELKRITKSSNEMQQKLMEDHRLVVDAAKQRHVQELSTERQHAEIRIDKVKQDLEASLESEKSKHQLETEVNREELKRTREDLSSQLSTANKEIERLEALVQDSQQGLVSANTHLGDLREAVDSLRTELGQTKLKLSESRDRTAAVQGEYDSLKALHDASLKKAGVTMESELGKLRLDLDAKWKNQMKAECDRLRKELTDEKEFDQKSTIDRLAKLKDAELTTAKLGWEKKVSELLEEITQLKKALNETEMNQMQKLDEVTKQKDEELHQMRRDMLSSVEQYDRKASSLKGMHTKEIESLEKTHKEQLKGLEDEMRRRHMEELKAQVDSHKIIVSTLREDLEKEKRLELDTQFKQNQQDLECLRVEMEQRLASEMEHVVFAHKEELRTARLELERALQVSKEKDSEKDFVISDLQDMVRTKEETTVRLQQEVKTLSKSLQNATKDLEQKANDVARLKKEAGRALKVKEAELQKRHSEDRFTLQSNHVLQMEDMVREFTAAQQLLKDKITQLQNMLEEAEERYQNREPREEDVEKIRKLNLVLMNKEEEMKKLSADKRYFQMELVNRETNFNKVFNADPKVGVLNPLAVPKQKPKSKEAPQRLSSSSSVSGLNPLPGSPFHDEKLNNHRPLPPLPRKFLH